LQRTSAARFELLSPAHRSDVLQRPRDYLESDITMETVFGPPDRDSPVSRKVGFGTSARASSRSNEISCFRSKRRSEITFAIPWPSVAGIRKQSSAPKFDDSAHHVFLSPLKCPRAVALIGYANTRGAALRTERNPPAKRDGWRQRERETGILIDGDQPGLLESISLSSRALSSWARV